MTEPLTIKLSLPQVIAVYVQLMRHKGFSNICSLDENNRTLTIHSNISTARMITECAVDDLTIYRTGGYAGQFQDFGTARSLKALAKKMK